MTHLLKYHFLKIHRIIFIHFHVKSLFYHMIFLHEILEKQVEVSYHTFKQLHKVVTRVNISTNIYTYSISFEPTTEKEQFASLRLRI